MHFVWIAGRLGADPETRFTPKGQKVTTMRVATNGKRGGKEETIWWRATLWGDQFDRMLPYLKKGSAVMVMGEMHKPEIYNDREGKAQISMELTADVVRFSPFGKEGSASSDGYAGMGRVAGSFADSAFPNFDSHSGQMGVEGSEEGSFAYDPLDAHTHQEIPF